MIDVDYLFFNTPTSKAPDSLERKPQIKVVQTVHSVPKIPRSGFGDSLENPQHSESFATAVDNFC